MIFSLAILRFVLICISLPTFYKENITYEKVRYRYQQVLLEYKRKTVQKFLYDIYSRCNIIKNLRCLHDKG